MQIHVETDKPPRHTMTAAEKRGLRSTLGVLRIVRKYLEPPYDPDEDDDVEFEGTAALVLHHGFEDIVERYAPAEPTPEPPETGKGKKGATDGD